MLDAKALNLIGLGMQSIGAIALYIQIWGKRWASGFKTESGGMVDKHGYWLTVIRYGWIVYIFSYVPLFIAMIKSP